MAGSPLDISQFKMHVALLDWVAIVGCYYTFHRTCNAAGCDSHAYHGVHVAHNVLFSFTIIILVTFEVLLECSTSINIVTQKLKPLSSDEGVPLGSFTTHHIKLPPIERMYSTVKQASTKTPNEPNASTHTHHAQYNSNR